MLLRGPTAAPEVLLGRRPAKAGFMPGRFVFPGGSLEPVDARPSGFAETLATPAPAGCDRATLRRLAAFAKAALRETWEETGLLLGRPHDGGGPDTATGPHWEAYRAAGLAPAFQALTLFGRAITPPGLPRRFHARFFLADGSLARGAPGGDGELEAVDWVPVAETRALPLPGITRHVLARALELRRSAAEAAATAAPLLSEEP